MKKSKKDRGAIGHRVWIDRRRLFKRYESNYGHPPGRRKGDDEPFFYPTVIEFGDSDTPAQKPLRQAVYGNERKIRDLFLRELRRALNIAL